MGEKNQPNPHKDERYREFAYRAIKRAILSGQLEVEKPLIEENLADMLRISRTPVREALIILEHEGLIGPRHGRGLYVRPITRQDFVEIYHANEIVTLEVMRRAARLITEEQIHAMGEDVSRAIFYASQGELPGFLLARRQLLRRLGDAAENNPLVNFMLNNQERLDIFLLNKRDTIAMDHIQVMAHQQEFILSALVHRDPDEVARLVNYHAQWMREQFSSFFTDFTEERNEFENLADF
jgi:DNA-binding GntR family transcriptional regulator